MALGVIGLVAATGLMLRLKMTPSVRITMSTLAVWQIPKSGVNLDRLDKIHEANKQLVSAVRLGGDGASGSGARHRGGAGGSLKGQGSGAE